MTEPDQVNCWCGYEGPEALHPAHPLHESFGLIWDGRRVLPKIDELRRGARILHEASLDGVAYALESLAVAFEKLQEGERPI